MNYQFLTNKQVGIVVLLSIGAVDHVPVVADQHPLLEQCRVGARVAELPPHAVTHVVHLHTTHYTELITSLVWKRTSTMLRMMPHKLSGTGDVSQYNCHIPLKFRLKTILCDQTKSSYSMKNLGDIFPKFGSSSIGRS